MDWLSKAVRFKSRMNCFQSLDKYENIHFLIDLGEYDNKKMTVWYKNEA